MKKSLLGLSIVTSIILSGCGGVNQANSGFAPTSVAQIMPNTEVVGWENYTDDADEDRVPDYLDRCPNTPLNAPVDKNGCLLDTDNDGVYNYLDECPNTPDGIEVGKDGCSLDSDGDGVRDIDDKCSNTPKGIEVDKFGCGLDIDKDGVLDLNDKCSNTPIGAIVDIYGCSLDDDKDGIANGLDKCPNTPTEAEVDKNGCALDNDKDGVINLYDKCPDTKEGILVGKDGCALDSDEDGVPDIKDKCPNTEKGIKVNFQGCPILAEYRFNFEFNSFKINESYYPEIEKLAKLLKENMEVSIEIQGFTDNVGSYLYNKELSLKRANALRKILIDKFNISPNRIKIIGYGSDNPIADNSTKEGQALNRRIVVISSNNIPKQDCLIEPEELNTTSIETNSTEEVKVDEESFEDKEKNIDR